MFNSILNGELSIVSALICMFTSLCLGGLLAIIQQHEKKDFLITLVVLPLIIQVVMLMVNGNLGTSVAILGAFSLIRFRSLQCNSKELLFIFMAVAIGLSTAMGYIVFACVFTFIACLAIVILNKFIFTREMKHLKIVVPEDLDYDSMFDETLNNYTSYYRLIKAKTINMGSLYELTYEICLKDIITKNLIDDIRVKNGNLKVALTHNIEE